MKITTTLAVTLGLCTLAACGGGAEENSANTDINMEMPAENLDMMAGNDMNGLDANGTINAADGMNATENAVVNDLTTNDADTNLANGT